MRSKGLMGFPASSARLERLARAQGFRLWETCECAEPDVQIVRLIEGDESVWIPPDVCVKCKRRASRVAQLPMFEE